jgi:hypothetical protein
MVGGDLRCKNLCGFWSLGVLLIDGMGLENLIDTLYITLWYLVL